MAEAVEERETRLAGEYETINRVEQAEEKYLNLVLINKESTTSLETYARFCLRHHKYDQAFALYSRINASAHEFKYRLILALFRIHRGREKEAAKVLQELEREESHSTEEKIIIHQLLALVEERLGQEKASERHTALAEKYFQMKNNPAIRINPPKNPYIEPAPKVPKPGRYVSQLSQQESQEIRLSLMQYFIEYNFFGLARGYLPKLSEG
jgi:tetratricopeptide (TPR) repeat protein